MPDPHAEPTSPTISYRLQAGTLTLAPLTPGRQRPVAQRFPRSPTQSVATPSVLPELPSSATAVAPLSVQDSEMPPTEHRQNPPPTHPVAPSALPLAAP